MRKLYLIASACTIFLCVGLNAQESAAERTDSVPFSRRNGRCCWMEENRHLIDMIRSTTFTEDSLSSSFFFTYFRSFEYCFRYWNENRMTYPKSCPDTDSCCTGIPSDTSTVAGLLLQLYCGDRELFFNRLRHDPAFADTRLRRLYIQEVRSMQHFREIRHMGYLTIAPLFGNSPSGSWQPNLGYAWGSNWEHIFTNWYVGCGLQKRGPRVTVRTRSELQPAETITGFETGADIGHTFTIAGKYGIDIIAGAGLHSLWVQPDNDTDTWVKTSFSPCTGIGTRLYLFNRNVLIQPLLRYWYVRHDDVLRHDERIRYHAVGLQLFIGPSDRRYREEGLERLGISPGEPDDIR